MRYRIAALTFFAVLGLIELADFAGTVATLSDPMRLSDAAEFLGVSESAERIRLMFLLPVTAGIAALSLSIAGGAVQREPRRSRRILVTGLLLFYAVFQGFTAIVFDLRVVAFAALFAVLCVIAWWFVRQVDGQMTRAVGPA
jgi:hypothetical protein